MIITFLRVRPAESVNEQSAAGRLREGTTALEVEGLSATDIAAASQAGLLAVAVNEGDPTAPAWVLDPAAALEAEIPGWRLTINAAQAGREEVLDALARTGAAYLRVLRSRVVELADIVTLPSIESAISVFVDDLEQAMGAIDSGATDLLLRDWDTEAVGLLRQAVSPHHLVERSALSPRVSIDEARQSLSPTSFTAWLQQVDGSGRIRPRTEWAPGRDLPIPAPSARLSAQWLDPQWIHSAAPSELAGAGSIRPVLERALAGRPPTLHELEQLLGAYGDQVEAVAWSADQLRRAANGDTVTYVINRNINYTNQCYFRCGFCAFSKGPRSLNLREEPYLIPVEGVVGLAVEAHERGATEVTLQGGIHPDFTGDFYLQVVEAIKARLPDMHIHGFTPLEIWQGASTLGITVKELLQRLIETGLGSLPGTAAEVLDDAVRLHLCPDKIRTAQWAEVMITAHELGLRATATLMFGHIDGPASWARHFEVIRQIQRRTGGFTEFVPLPFVHMGAPIYLRGKARPGPTWDEAVLIHAVARLAFDGLIPNIQASWVKLGLDGGRRLLDAGCNDLGGTLMGEIITRSAGAAHGQEVTPEEFHAVIRAAGRQPARRSTTYEVLEPV